MSRPRFSILLAWLLLAGCKHGEDDTSKRFAVEFSAFDDREAPVAGAKFLLGAKELWRSDSGGRAVLQLRGQEGQELALSVECPEGHILEKPPGRLRLSRVKRLTADAEKPIGFGARCERTTKEVVLVVRAERGKGTILRVSNGAEVALNDDGVAHLPLTVPRGDKALHVAFDTRNVPRLSPKNPERSLDLPSGDGLLLLSQDFSVAKSAISSKKSRAPARHVPYRIQ